MSLLRIWFILNCFMLSYSCDQYTTKDADPQQADTEYTKRELKSIVMRDVDTDKDGKVSFEELKKYLAELHEKNIEYNVNKQWLDYSPQIHEVFSWEGYEPEKKEVLTWDHYFNQTYPELEGVDIGIPMVREQETSNILNNEQNKKQEKTDSHEELDPRLAELKVMVQRADARWKLADDNGDTLLTKQEFKFLLYPDEGHEELQKLFIKEATEDVDENKDNKISLDEFMKHLKVLASEQESTDEDWLSSQHENFGRLLDKNKDGILDEAEIKDWLAPSKKVKFESEASRLFSIGDANDDQNLSIVEILDKYEHFTGLLPSEYWQHIEEEEEADTASSYPDDPDESHAQHDEL